MKPSGRRTVNVMESSSDLTESPVVEAQNEEEVLGYIGETRYEWILPNSSMTMRTTTDSDALLALQERPERSVSASKMPHLTNPRTLQGWVDRQAQGGEQGPALKYLGCNQSCAYGHVSPDAVIASSLSVS